METSQASASLDETTQNQVQKLVASELEKALQRHPNAAQDLYQNNLSHRIIRLEERTEDFKKLALEIKERVVKLEEKSMYQMRLIEEKATNQMQLTEQKSTYLTKLIEEKAAHQMQVMNERFAASDKRFEDLLRSMKEQFAAVDKRFEDMNRRFEDVNKRFEAVDKRFDDMNKRFDDLHKQFERLIRTLKWLFAFGVSIITILITVYKFLDKFI